MADLPCLISDSRRKLRSNLFEKPSGSKPTSPGREPSSFGGRSKNGMALLASMEKRAVRGETARDTRAPTKAGRDRAGAKAETKAYMMDEADGVDGDEFSEGERGKGCRMMQREEEGEEGEEGMGNAG